MPIFQHVSGPVIVYIKFENLPVSNNFVLYPSEVVNTSVLGFEALGICESTPNYEEFYNYKAITNQMSGDSLPLDETWEGSKMVISLVLTLYDANLFRLLRQNFTTLNRVGIDTPHTDRGRTVYGFSTCRLILQNTFFGTPNAALSDIPGYYFYFAKLVAATPIDGGTSINKLGLVFECVPGYVPPSRQRRIWGQFITFSTPTSISTLTVT
jgi:hypothetical protein